MKRLISFLLVIIVLISCTPEKRLKRFKNKYPYLFYSEKVIIRDTVITKEIQTDTLFSIKFDTISIEKDNLQIKLIKQDTLIYLQAKVSEDTIYIQKEVEVIKDKLIQQPKKVNIWIFLFIFSTILVILLIVKK